MPEKRFEICPAADLQPGGRIIKTLDGFSVGVFNIDGDYYALKNDCPHQRAPLCEGDLTGTTVSDTPGEYEWVNDGQIIQCPWHGWEFDVTTGESVFNPHRVKAKTFEAKIETKNDTTNETEPASLEDNTTSSAEACTECAVSIEGDETPVETYDAGVEHGTVVVYL